MNDCSYSLAEKSMPRNSLHKAGRYSTTLRFSQFQLTCCYLIFITANRFLKSFLAGCLLLLQQNIYINGRLPKPINFMKKLFLLTLLLSCVFSHSFAQRTQNANKELMVKNGFFGWQFYSGRERINLSEVTDLMKPNEEATAYLRSAKTNYTWAQIVGSVGGFMIGYPLGASAGGGTPNWTMAGIGAGLAVVSIPLSIKAGKQVKNAIVAYNESTRSTSYRKPSFHAGITGNGIGLKMAF